MDIFEMLPLVSFILLWNMTIVFVLRFRNLPPDRKLDQPIALLELRASAAYDYHCHPSLHGSTETLMCTSA